MKVEAYYPQRLLISLVVLFCILALGPAMGGLMDCQAQEGARRAPSRPRSAASTVGYAGRDQRALADVSEDYLINPGDVIDIQVDRAPELSTLYDVTASGTIRMVYLGPIKAHGTADELASFIANSLSDRYLKNPRDCDYRADQQPSLLHPGDQSPRGLSDRGASVAADVDRLAGGLTENYGSTAFIIREAYRPEMDVPDKGDPKALDSQPESAAADSPSQPEIAIRRRRSGRV